jgi:hypothetical protein
MTTSTHPADESNDGARIDMSRAAMQMALDAIEGSGRRSRPRSLRRLTPG